MLKAIETITVVNHMVENGADSYRCTVVHGASWYWKNKVTVNSGLQYARLLRCRIPAENMPDGLTVLPGDKVVLGSLQSVTGQEFSKLTRLYEGASVLDVHKNLFGIHPHLYIEGA